MLGRPVKAHNTSTRHLLVSLSTTSQEIKRSCRNANASVYLPHIGREFFTIYIHGHTVTPSIRLANSCEAAFYKAFYIGVGNLYICPYLGSYTVSQQVYIFGVGMDSSQEDDIGYGQGEWEGRSNV